MPWRDDHDYACDAAWRRDAAGARGRRRATGAARGNTNVYAISSGGQLHTLNPQTGDDLSPPVKLLPPNAKAIGAVLIDPILYVSTRDGCGSAPNGVYALDLSSNPKQVTQWEANGANVVGSAGPTFVTDGNLFVATDGGAASSNDANAVVALDRLTLKPKDWFSPGKTAFTASPVAFQYKGKHLIVAANADGRLYVLDAASLGGADHRTPLSAAHRIRRPPTLRPARWRRRGGRLEVDLRGEAGPLRPDSIAPFVDQRRRDRRRDRCLQAGRSGGSADLQPARTSRDMVSPAPPTIVSAPSFTISSLASIGAPTHRRPRSGAAFQPAVLVRAGRRRARLWSSGTTIASFVRRCRAVSGASSQVYVVTIRAAPCTTLGIPLSSIEIEEQHETSRLDDHHCPFPLAPCGTRALAAAARRPWTG